MGFFSVSQAAREQGGMNQYSQRLLREMEQTVIIVSCKLGLKKKRSQASSETFFDLNLYPRNKWGYIRLSSICLSSSIPEITILESGRSSFSGSLLS